MSLSTVRVAFLDVGQGDTIVVSLPEAREAVVVDCIAATSVFDYLKHEGIQVVRALVITHLHADHYRQATAFLDNCERETGARCEKLVLDVLPEEEGTLAPLSDDHSESNIPPAIRLTVYQQLESWMMRNLLLVDRPNSAVELPIDGPLRQKIRFLHPFPAVLARARASGFNNSSIVLRVDGTGSSALLTGDLEPEGWRLLKRNPVTRHLAKGDVIKFPHHGAWKEPDGAASDSNTFLAEVGAKKVVISVGTEQKGYAHPDAHVLKAIRDRKLHLLCTQATKRCGGPDVLELRPRTTTELSTRRCSGVRPVGWSAKGCPCAGTVVLDLDRTITVIQPDPEYHRREIVEKVFAPNNQCAI